jgi:hypothetical protein
LPTTILTRSYSSCPTALTVNTSAQLVSPTSSYDLLVPTHGRSLTSFWNK